MVGADQAGLAAAQRLRKRGLSTVVVEFEAEPVGFWPSAIGTYAEIGGRVGVATASDVACDVPITLVGNAFARRRVDCPRLTRPNRIPTVAA
ncbi:hypothetical protein [Nocardia fluminea]|uniref:hypothetical protein n=1 Tax=Nocardia fluminea TaxID=134984 RepID=UPI003787AAED